MAVIKYNLLNDRNKKLSANFTVREFACKDGNVAVLVDDKLVNGLQKIRDHFGKPIKINSAYRTAAHNKAVGGSPNSQHLQGKAACSCALIIASCRAFTVCPACAKFKHC